MLTSLLEGEIDIEIINRMSQSLDFVMMKQRMATIFLRFSQILLENDQLTIFDITITKVNSKLTRESFDGSVNEAFTIYILIHSLADSSKEADEHL